MKLLGCAFVGVGAFVAFGIYNSMHHWIPAGHVGLLYSPSGGLDKTPYPPSRIFVPPMSTLYLYPTVERSAIYTDDPDEGEVKEADSVKVTTNDPAQVNFDVVVNYHIEPNDVIKIFDNYKGQKLEQIQSTIIRAAVRQQASAVGKDYDQFTLMGSGRIEASNKLTSLLQADLGQRGITVDSAKFAAPYVNDQIMQRIISNVNSETDLKIAEINKQKAEANKAIALTTATAQAESSRLKSAQTKPKSLELMQLELDIETMKRWNGHLTQYMLGSNPNIMLPMAAPESPSPAPNRSRRSAN